jgi:flagellar protein FlgJ
MKITTISNGAPPLPPTLREVTQEFESLLVSRMLQAMRRTVPEGGLIGAGGEQLFRSLLDEELAQQVASAGGFGLGAMLYRQLEAQDDTALLPVSNVDEDRSS